MIKFFVKAYLWIARLAQLHLKILKYTYNSSQKKGKFCLKDAQFIFVIVC
jgi:hypothetical protein